jgi:Ner family transcriptional regulator
MSGEEIPRDAEQKRHWIKYQLGLHGQTFADIGRELGITRQTARSVLFKSYPRIEQLLAAKIGYAPEVIWPERYSNRRKEQVYVSA